MRPAECNLLILTDRLMDDDLYPLQGKSVDFPIIEHRFNSSLTSKSSALHTAEKNRIYMKFLDNYDVLLEKNEALQANRPFLEYDSEVLMQNDLENATERARNTLKISCFTQILRDIVQTTTLPKKALRRLEKRMGIK